MKAESTIMKEMQRLWRRKEFYEKHGEIKSGRSWQEDQQYGACMALRWALGQCAKMSGTCSEYDQTKKQAKRA